MTADEQQYAFEDALPAQLERLRTLELLFDAGTIRHLEALGVGAGWRCLEVGAGAGSVAGWLCERVGPDGSVLATDLDTRHLAALAHPNLEVRVHDVLVHALPESAFDLVHLRCVLAWLPDRRTALERLAEALRPGGWLLAEELDFGSVAPDPRMEAPARASFTRALDARNEVLAARSGFDALYGRRLAGDLRDAGLQDVHCEGRASMWRSGEPGGRAWQLTLAELRGQIVESRLAAAEDVDAAIAVCADGLDCISPLAMAAWGRRS
jgi:SAM-dependent methyltransferase